MVKQLLTEISEKYKLWMKRYKVLIYTWSFENRVCELILLLGNLKQ